MCCLFTELWLIFPETWTVQIIFLWKGNRMFCLQNWSLKDKKRCKVFRVCCLRDQTLNLPDPFKVEGFSAGIILVYWTRVSSKTKTLTDEFLLVLFPWNQTLLSFKERIYIYLFCECCRLHISFEKIRWVNSLDSFDLYMNWEATSFWGVDMSLQHFLMSSILSWLTFLFVE